MSLQKKARWRAPRAVRRAVRAVRWFLRRGPGVVPAAPAAEVIGIYMSRCRKVLDAVTVRVRSVLPGPVDTCVRDVPRWYSV
ncbi:hypothetical protein AB852_17645 [Streptomyces uncialis]|uniref:Uncharacterized protein n=1 Tax=Streptomyces uncialis TaxID=1048205 RepID=A0A1Q4V6H5_9ACTN|nr:hypothetical protein AB852_17645 [Streptomyces uncialis]